MGFSEINVLVGVRTYVPASSIVAQVDFPKGTIRFDTFEL
jgi:hypothetical protein